MNDKKEENPFKEYLYERDAVKRYLSTKYPTFYKDFKRKFDELFREWEISLNLKSSIDKPFKDELFRKYCIFIKAIIQTELFYETVLIEVEKNGKPKSKKSLYNQHLKIFNNLVESLFILPEVIIYSFTDDIKKVNERLDKWENKYGIYPKDIFRVALDIQNKNKGKRPKITNEDAIVLANDQLKYYNNIELIDDFGQRTKLLWDLKKTYENHHKKKLRKENI